MKRLGFVILLLLSLTGIYSAKASHVMGAEITWTCVGQDSFIVKLVAYRDCNGISMSVHDTINFKCATTGVLITSLGITAGTPTDITPVCKTSCTRCQSLTCSFPYGIQRYSMQGLVILNAAGSCCNITILWDGNQRNVAITTIQNAGISNFNIEAQLNRCLNPCDNSPTFSNNPVQILCVGQHFTFTHGIQDFDDNTTGGLSDSLTYEWAQPMGVSPNYLTYNSPYAYNLPIYFWGFPNNALPFPRGFHLDPATGDVEFTPMKAEVTVMVLQVNEFRNGIKIGEVRRDFEIMVINCTSNNPPTISTPNNIRTKHVGSGSCASFTFTTNDQNTNDTVSISWNNALTGATWTNTNGLSKQPTGTLTWIPTNADIGSLPHTFTVTAKDNACPMNAQFTQAYQFIVHPGVNAQPVAFSNSICGPGILVLSATGAIAGEIFRWYTQPCGGSVLQSDTANSATDSSHYSVFLNKTDTFYVAIDSAGVEGLRMKVVGTILPLPVDLHQTFKTTFPDSGMVAYYPFNGNAKDSSGTGNHGIVNGATLTADRFGNANKAYSFNGSSSFIEVPNSPSLNIQNSMSLVAWFKTSNPYKLPDLKGGYMIAKNQNAGNRSYDLVADWDNTDSLRFALFEVGDAVGNEKFNPVFYKNSVFFDNGWHCIVGTYDNNSGYSKIYLDGVLKNTHITGHKNILPSSVSLTIGCYHDGGIGFRGFFNGSLDDIRIYNRALTPLEIKSISYEGMTVSVAVSDDTICSKQPDTLIIFNAQPDIIYQLYRNNIPYGYVQLGRGDTLRFPLDTLTSSANFRIFATDQTTNCSKWLDTTIYIQVNCCIADLGSPVNSQPSTNGLVAYYPFNGNANDESGNGNNGTVNGATLTTDRFGNANSAYSFNGIANNIMIPNSPSFAFDTLNFTISIWLKYNSQSGGTTDYAAIFIKALLTYPEHGISLFVDYPPPILNKIGFRISRVLEFYSNSNSLHGQWHHIVFQRENNYLKLYIDGVLDSKYLSTNINCTNNQPIWLGSNHVISTSQNYNGIMDDIRIYNRAITDFEVSRIYNEKRKLLLSISNDSICNYETSEIFLMNSQPGVEYSLVKAIDSLLVGVSKFGKPDSLIFPVGKLLKTTAFLINAKDTSGKCAIYLDTILTIHVKSKPVTVFSMLDSTSCLKGNKFQFSNYSSIKSPDTFINLWNFGDNSNSTDFAPAHSYSKTGTFAVKLLTTSNKGCKDSLSKTVSIYSQSVPAFTMNDSSQCLSVNQFNFINTTSGAKSFLWNFGDVTSDTNRQTSHQYAKADTFMVSLIAATQFGCKDTVSKSLIVLPSPESDYSINDSIQCVLANSFSFTNHTKGTKNYIWNFGDGKTDTASNPVYSYASAGTYFVRLEAKNAIGCIDTISRKIEVGPLAIAAFTVNSKQQFLSGNNFVFSSGATTPATNMKYYWDFGDGGTSTSSNPAHSYSAIDSFIVIMIATSDFGCADTFTDTVFVLKNPVKLASFSAQNACVGDEVIFNNTSKVIPPDSFLNFSWDFGDGSTIIRKNPKHIYAAAGTYIIRLGVLTAAGIRDTIRDTIEIFTDPVVSISATPDTIIIPGRPVTLTASGLYDQLLWSDNSTSGTISVTTAGIYWVTASYANGCKSYDSITLTKGEIKEPEIVNVISPNGDGFNDKLVIKNIDLVKPCKLKIYNRWGDELYSNSDYQNYWDGTYKGKKLPEGTYYYVLETRDSKVYKGAVNILK
jgi:gliding motility-associated-like protein